MMLGLRLVSQSFQNHRCLQPLPLRKPMSLSTSRIPVLFLSVLVLVATTVHARSLPPSSNLPTIIKLDTVHIPADTNPPHFVAITVAQTLNSYGSKRLAPGKGSLRRRVQLWLSLGIFLLSVYLYWVGGYPMLSVEASRGAIYSWLFVY
ncbi:hypothetical protein BC830DRAFT_1143561 [Chytriomyces sp. MP71]|nr:hypothetical protein BC830DRAFT_1143561 [Chytriomyces sp. MP71]